jgi:hypothetical protein
MTTKSREVIWGGRHNPLDGALAAVTECRRQTGALRSTDFALGILVGRVTLNRVSYPPPSAPNAEQAIWASNLSLGHPKYLCI